MSTSVCRCRRGLRVAPMETTGRCSECPRRVECGETAWSCKKCNYTQCGTCWHRTAHKTLSWSLQPRTALRKAGVQTSLIHFNSKWDRMYVDMAHPQLNTSHLTTGWDGDLGRTPPYFCPVGFQRFALDTSKYDPVWKDMPVFYHGLEGHNVHRILAEGFRPSLCQHGKKAVYFSPSIHYSAHPRYARVYVGDKWYQVLLEVRVALSTLTKYTGETMKVGEKHVIDPHFADDKGMEFLYSSETNIGPRQGCFVTGIMLRTCSVDPLTLPTSLWWTCWLDEKDTQTKQAKLREGYYRPCLV
eukprot:NODE_1135_length_1086_cov_741.427194_g868_i0.p1 GENE.NODE_1135_length_1086_cov_741.427194_g868_i0~~NODE_1135_length_1086_cov_741.427194_g868_i0.p1  ORF type:complete len:300 (-),score=14.46 NODE_1135_length_1086_cov_741.427194_g868_i0:130-1029(-)